MKAMSTIMALAAISAAAAAQDSPNRGSGFPGDKGRIFNGLPMPKGPLPPRPPEAPLSIAPTADASLIAAKAAVAECRGYHIGVSVIDAAGLPKLFYIPDGTAGSHAYTAFRKAYTALKFERPTEQVGALTETDEAIKNQVIGDGNLFTFPGGLPIYMNGKIVGAIGVSGAESTVDERCAVAALHSIGARSSFK